MRMIPPYFDKATSNAEKKLFRFFCEAGGLDEWYCLHSLGISRHLCKREGEIDFLFIGPEGTIVLEVKGGRVHRSNGLWRFTDRYGRVTQKVESPFAQARTSLYSLRADLAQHFGKSLNQYIFGYGAAFPDITFQIESPEWEKSMVFDSRNLSQPCREFIAEISGYWNSRQRNTQRLNKRTIEQIISYVRGDFEIVRPISIEIEESEANILKLTNEQYGCLDAMEENERTIFVGPAGTGKTLLAVERARRNQQRGTRTLFLCFNRLLGSYLTEVAHKERLSLVTVDSLHRFFYKSIISKGHCDELERKPEPPRLFTEIYPEYFLRTWNPDNTYQELIIDEGQDVLTAEYITALDATIKGGFEKGNWTIFMDPETQRDMFSSFDEDIYRELKKFSASYRLTVNCRNTKPIAVQAEVISGYNLGQVKKVEGLPVKYLWYNGLIDQAAQVTECVNMLLKEGFTAENITILSAKRYQSSIAGSGRLRLKTGHYQLGKGSYSAHKNLIACGSIQSFKGLESSIVILTDIEDIDADDMRTVNYVGYTRARTALWVSINRKLKRKYEEHFVKIAAYKEVK